MAIFYTFGTINPDSPVGGLQEPFNVVQTGNTGLTGDNYVYDGVGSVGKINSDGSITFLPGWGSDGGDDYGYVNIFSNQYDANGDSILAARVNDNDVQMTKNDSSIVNYMNQVQAQTAASENNGLFDKVMAVATNPTTSLAVAAAVVAPALAPAIGAELGLTGTAAAAAGYGAIGAGTGAITAAANGGDASQIAQAALVGGVSGAAGGAIGSEAKSLVPDLGAAGAAAVGGAAKGAITPALTGGSIGAGAAGGALGSALGTEIGGTTGNILGGATGSATAAQLAGQNVEQSALYGGIQGAVGGLAKSIFNPQTGQQVAYNPQPTQLAENQPTVTIDSLSNPQQTTDAQSGTFQATPLPAGVMWNPDVNQYTYADGSIYQPTLNEPSGDSLYLSNAGTYPSSTADYSGGGSRSSTLGGALGTQTTQPLSAGALDVTGKQTSTIDEGGTTQKGQATPSDKLQLISPTIVSSGGTSPQVLSSVLGAPSSSILGQALQSSNPDPATTGNPIFQGDDKNQRNVWNTESLRTALGLS